MFNRFVTTTASASLTAAIGYKTYQQLKQDPSHADANQSAPFFHAAVVNNPHFKKRYKGGEDGFVISDSKKFIAVADGVGGWASKDICSGKCAKFLMKTCGELFEKDHTQSLKDILLEGHKEIVKADIEGSTTAVLAKIEESSDQATLKTLNFGDSAYLLLRPRDNMPMEKLFRSKEQTHFFNCPY